MILEHASANCLRFCALSLPDQRVEEEALCGERTHVVGPERAGPRGERLQYTQILRLRTITARGARGGRSKNVFFARPCGLQ